MPRKYPDKPASPSPEDPADAGGETYAPRGGPPPDVPGRPREATRATKAASPPPAPGEGRKESSGNRSRARGSRAGRSASRADAASGAGVTGSREGRGVSPGSRSRAGNRSSGTRPAPSEGTGRIEAAREDAEGRVHAVSLSRTVAKRPRLGFKLKFLISIAGGIFFFVLVAGILSLTIADATFEEEAMKRGADMARTYATIADNYLRDFAAKAAENARAEPKQKQSDEQMFKALEGAYRDKLRSALTARDTGGDTITIIFQDDDAAALIRFQLNERKIALPGDAGQPVRVGGADTGVRKTALTVEVDGRRDPVNVFTTTTAGDGRKMRVALVLSAEALEGSRRSMKLWMFVTILFSVVAGGGLAWWLAMRVTGPLKRFMEDLEEIGDGNLDHQVGVKTNDEIGQLAEAFNIMTVNLRHAQEAEMALMKQEHEMAIASQIQRNLTPSSTPEIAGYDVAHFYVSAGNVGGDYVDFLPLDADRVGIVIADVSGKGVPAAIVMAMTRAFLRADALNGDAGGVDYSPRRVLTSVNKRLSDDIRRGMFVTAQYLIIDRQKHRVTFASAGHNPMVVWRARTETVELVTANGMALGFHGGELFERNLQEKVVLLEPGDRIVLYTDGVTEAYDEQRDLFGEKRLYAVTKKAGALGSADFIRALVKAVENFRGQAAQSDDMTIISLLRSRASEP